jgi:hypothetical protein
MMPRRLGTSARHGEAGGGSSGLGSRACFDNQRRRRRDCGIPFVLFRRSIGELVEQNLETRFLSGACDLSHGCRGFHWIRYMAANKFFKRAHAGRYCVNVAGHCANYFRRLCYLGNMGFRSEILDRQTMAGRERRLLRSLRRPDNCGMGTIQATGPLSTVWTQGEEVNWPLRIVPVLSTSVIYIRDFSNSVSGVAVSFTNCCPIPSINNVSDTIK